MGLSESCAHEDTHTHRQTACFIQAPLPSHRPMHACVPTRTGRRWPSSPYRSARRRPPRSPGTCEPPPAAPPTPTPAATPIQPSCTAKPASPAQATALSEAIYDTQGKLLLLLTALDAFLSGCHFIASRRYLMMGTHSQPRPQVSQRVSSARSRLLVLAISLLEHG